MRKFFRRLKIISRILILLVAAAVLVLYKPELVERYLHVNPTEIVEKYLHGNPRDALQEFLGRRGATAPASATASPSVLELYPSGSIPTTPASLPAYTGELVTVLSGNVPGFGLEGLSYRGSYAHYSELDALGRAVAAHFGSGAQADGSILTNARQAGAVERAARATDDAIRAMASGMTPDAVLLDVEAAMAALGEITGRHVREEITARIFERFCVGK